jgi:hypothetical protein
MAERDGRPAHTDADGAGADHAWLLVELRGHRRSERRVSADWPRYDQHSPRRIGFLTGGPTEEISADAYSQEHHCVLWDALAPAKAP